MQKLFWYATGSKHTYVINMYTNIPKYLANLMIVYMTLSYYHWIANSNYMEISIKTQNLSFKNIILKTSSVK